jgi:hypothetical protein
MTNFKADLSIPMMYLHLKFQPYTYIPTRITEWKPSDHDHANSILTRVFLDVSAQAISTLYIHPYKS